MLSPKMEFMVCMQTFATFVGIETSEMYAPGPPSWSRRYMKPSTRRKKPNDTWTVEKQNMATAVDRTTGLTAPGFWLYLAINRYKKNRKVLIPGRRRR